MFRVLFELYRVWVRGFVRVLSGYRFLLFILGFGEAGAGVWLGWARLGWARLGSAGLLGWH